LNIAEVSGLTLRDTIVRLMDAGLDSSRRRRGNSGRRGSPANRAPEVYDRGMAAHASHRALAGMRTTATMMFGCGETLEHRVNHFERVRQLQEETGGFTAFIPWFFPNAPTLRSATSSRKK